MIGVPVIINHQDVSKENADEIRRGVVSDVWYNPEINWFECAGVIWDETAQNLITDKGWSVSCSYDVKLADDAGGTENNIPYDIEFLDGVFTHLAIVDNPRYERANIVFNSKTVVQNFDPNQKRDEKGQWTKDDAVIQKKKDSLTPIEVKPEEVPKFKTKEELGEWFSGIFKDLGSVTIEDTGIRIDLYKSNAEREASKRRLQQEPNKAVAKAFEDVVTKSVKVDERQKDERHKHNQEIYYNKLKLGDDFYDVNLFVDYLEPNKEHRYAGHSTTKIDNKISASDTQVINHIMLTKADNNISTRDLQTSKIIIHTKMDNNIITDIQEDFNPDINNVHNNKEHDMALIDELKKLITKVENEKPEGENMDDTKKVKNEKVDKRKLIDEVAGIMKSAGADDEKIRTAIAKMEKLADDKSEAGTADNEKEDDPKSEKDTADNKKVKNEDEEDEKKYDDLKKDVKEDVQNKCKNSVDNAKGGYFDKMNEIYNAATQPAEENTYISREQKLKYAEEYFAK